MPQETQSPEVVISTSGLNSYGSRVLTEGINLEQYKKNPVLLFMHERFSKDASNPPLPIGRMENLRIEGDKLIGRPVFDVEDPFAIRIKNKWDKGFLKMASAGLDILELSEDKGHLLEGQTRMTVSRSKLYEVSIVDIGANDEALQLSLRQDGELLQLDKRGSCSIPPLKTQNSSTNLKLKNAMSEEMLLTLGLNSESEEQAINDAVMSLSKKVEALEQENEMLKADLVANVINEAVAGGRIREDAKEGLVSLGKEIGRERLQVLLSAFKPQEPTAAPIPPRPNITLVGAVASPLGKAWEEMTDKERLELRHSDKEAYATAYQKYYGIPFQD